MLDTPLWKKISLWVFTLALAAAAIPSLISSFTSSDEPAPAPADDVTAEAPAFPEVDGEDEEESSLPQINLGLDLAGGSHLLLEANPADVASQRLENMEEAVESALRQAVPAIEFGDTSRSDGQLSFILDSVADIDRARAVLEPIMMGDGLRREWDLSVVDGQRIVLSPTDAGQATALNSAMEGAVEVVRRRIDLLGTREPTIIRQGENRIVVQVPGLQDPVALKRLLGETAELEFKLVDQQALPTNTAAGVANPGSQIYPYAPETDFAGQFEAVKRLGGIRGDSLINARAGVDPQTNENVVNIQFDQQGGQKFAQLSTENVGERFAIILDGEVISAPFFNEPILGGSAQISGAFTPDTANELAISLQSGALPVPLTVVEERTVGPDLGAESIRSGLIAMLIGSIAVIALMVATYGRFGVYATAALVFNVLILLGLMAIGNFTLTLPGIAGFVLTVGAAVDANVLINERIREERKRGRKVITAVENGYKEASRAIYDANVTNFIAGVLLFWFGSGPIRGFAVVLVIGLATSVFTALTLTKMWVSGYLAAKRPKDITI
ncbi:preprotein translocase subunit [Erythrobacter sp. NAP1]|uniref:protein translocase subunit SecD n=1 Tax=Erythrobacter sp. NAP1 TaxID=237727 RepID=UPI0000686EB3|nr:protein translocase subunit SecD [Erythrobacter sp. NAP1]EAQ29616.1 preprotein translocase subunit [Erythrobacter sp. NAP1]